MPPGCVPHHLARSRLSPLSSFPTVFPACRCCQNDPSEEWAQEPMGGPTTNAAATRSDIGFAVRQGEDARSGVDGGGNQQLPLELATTSTPRWTFTKLVLHTCPHSHGEPMCP